MNRAAIVIGAAAGVALLVIGAQRAVAAVAQQVEQPAEPVQEWGEGPLTWLQNAIEGNGEAAAVGTMPMNEQKNVEAFLRMIRSAEGTAGDNGYRTIVGGGLFDDWADHPRKLIPFTQTDGKVNHSSAAGAYQFLQKTWDTLRVRLALPDFSPASQDAAAIELIREAGALGDVRNGRFDEAVKRVNRIWASLPGAPYPQKQRSVAYVRAAYESAGGAYA